MEQNNKLIEETNSNQEIQKDIKTQLPEETPEQINWKKFREKREEERKLAEKRISEEKERAEKATAEAKALKEAIDAILTRDEGSNSNGASLSDDERLAKLVAEEVERAEREKEKRRMEQEAKEWPQRLIREVPDFDKVCTTENLDYLEYHHPEIASAFKDLPDGYGKWKNIYSVIKKMIPNPSSDKDEKRMEKNLSKPRSISTPGLPSTGDMAPHSLDDARKRNNWSRMQKVMRGA